MFLCVLPLGFLGVLMSRHMMANFFSMSMTLGASANMLSTRLANKPSGCMLRHGACSSYEKLPFKQVCWMGLSIRLYRVSTTDAKAQRLATLRYGKRRLPRSTNASAKKSDAWVCRLRDTAQNVEAAPCRAHSKGRKETAQ